MGLFNNYMKPGKGVSKDEPEKKGFFLYWDILFHKLSKIIGSNCMLMLTGILWLAVLMFLFMQFIVPFNPDNIMGVLQNQGAEDVEGTAQALMLSLYMMFAVAAFTLLGCGPVSASYSYIMKCFTNREHAWIFSDGWDKFKENFKQAIFVVIMDAVVIIVSSIALRFYYIKFTEGGMIFGIPCYILIVALIAYVWIHFYIYQIMVTFECTIKQLYKNALIFALGKLPMNIVLTILCVGVSAAPFFFIGNPFVAVILTAVAGLCFSRFAVEFYAARCIKKTILASMSNEGVNIKYDNRSEEGTENVSDETMLDDGPVFDDDLASKLSKKPEDRK